MTWNVSKKLGKKDNDKILLEIERIANEILHLCNIVS